MGRWWLSGVGNFVLPCAESSSALKAARLDNSKRAHYVPKIPTYV